MGALQVVKPGLLTTVQDLGRYGHQASGVPVAGPMDTFSHRLANQLAGNDADAATLEVTLIGPEMIIDASTTMAIAGAGILVLTWRFGWIRLSVLGASVLYAAEIFWLHRSTPDHLAVMCVLVGGMWILWQLPDFFHRPADEASRLTHGSLVVINFMGILVTGILLHEWLKLPRTGARNHAGSISSARESAACGMSSLARLAETYPAGQFCSTTCPGSSPDWSATPWQCPLAVASATASGAGAHACAAIAVWHRSRDALAIAASKPLAEREKVMARILSADAAAYKPRPAPDLS